MQPRTCAAALLAAGVAALAAQTAPSPPAPGQPPATAGQPQDAQRPTFRTEANFVRVDVYPTAGGKPVADLRREDFEILEDGRPQTIDSFEYVRIAPAGPAAARRADPNTIEAMRQAAADPRSRVFVIFLDALHVTRDGAKNIGPALVRFIDRLLGPDDLIGVMTPWMSPADVVLQRKTSVIESGLRDAAWGKRFTMDEDAREAMYKSCYRLLYQEQQQGKTVSDLAKVLTVRRREELTLDALRDLVVYLRGLREERKAILAVTEGWVLYRPNAEITRLREECSCPPEQRRRDLQDCSGCTPYPPQNGWKESVPGGEPLRIGPGGRPTVGSIQTPGGDVSVDACNSDRMRLASIDHGQALNDLTQDANRANATFYTIDPRGLAVFDTPIYRDADEVGLPLNVGDDQSSLRQRHDAMANLASATDGIALMNSNDLDAGLRRIADDSSTYYLIGYYSSNGRLDGKYRSITVRVKRQGVSVRARRGYRAPTEAEVAAARAQSTAAATVAEPLSAVAAAINTLTRIRPDARFRVHAIPMRTAANGPATSLAVVGELPSGMQGWAQGGTVTLEIAGTSAQPATVTLKPGDRAFLTSIPIAGAPATVDLRARLSNADATVTPFTESVRVNLAPGPSQPLLFRRGLVTGNRLQPAADFQFTRGERLRVEVPLFENMKAGPGRLLDRAGQELKIPVTMSERADPNGQRWLTADITLAPLGAGDYVVETSASSPSGSEKVLTAFRVTK
jgi:VWFA-related protein